MEQNIHIFKKTQFDGTQSDHMEKRTLFVKEFFNSHHLEWSYFTAEIENFTR